MKETSRADRHHQALLALTSSSSSPPSPALLVSSSAPDSSSPACPPPFSDHTDTNTELDSTFCAAGASRLRTLTHLQLVQFLSDLDEAQVKLPAEVVGQTAVVVMETQVSGTHLAHPQLLLLEAGGRHGVSVLLLWDQTAHEYDEAETKNVPLKFLLSHLCVLLSSADLLHLLQDLLGFIYVPLGSQLLGLREEFPYFLVQLVNFLRLRRKKKHTFKPEPRRKNTQITCERELAPWPPPRH